MRIFKFLIAIFSILFFSGCSLVPSFKNEGEVTLKYWGLWETASTINQVIADYQKINPNVKIIYEKKSPQQYRESLQSQISQGRGPDLFRFHNTWTPMLSDVLAEVPSDVISQNEVKKNFYPTESADLRNSQNKLVGVPFEIDGLGLFWNEDMFNAAGITVPPSTWRDLAQDAARLTVRGPSGNITTAGIALGTASNIDHFSD